MARKLYWIKERCAEVALLCETKGEFKKKYPTAYSNAAKKKWIDEICSHMRIVYPPRSKQECLEAALTCKSRWEFSKKFKGHYKKAWKMGWLDEICGTMKSRLNLKTKKECEIEASKYTSRVDFGRNSTSHYKRAAKMKWLDEICSHMPCMIGGWSRTRFIERCKKIGGCGIFYIIRCFNDNEEFFKFGITSKSVKERYPNKHNLPYDFEIFFEINLSSTKVYDFEGNFQKIVKHRKYTPLIDFCGKTECFK